MGSMVVEWVPSDLGESGPTAVRIGGGFDKRWCVGGQPMGSQGARVGSEGNVRSLLENHSWIWMEQRAGMACGLWY